MARRDTEWYIHVSAAAECVCVCARFSSWLWCKMRKCMQRHFAMRFIKFHAKTAHNLHNHAQFACNPVCLFVWLRLYCSIRSHSRSTLDRMQVVLVCMQIHTNTLAHIMLSEENLSEEHASASTSSIAITNCYYFKNTKFSLQIQLELPTFVWNLTTNFRVIFSTRNLQLKFSHFTIICAYALRTDARTHFRPSHCQLCCVSFACTWNGKNSKFLIRNEVKQKEERENKWFHTKAKLLINFHRQARIECLSATCICWGRLRIHLFWLAKLFDFRNRRVLLQSEIIFSFEKLMITPNRASRKVNLFQREKTNSAIANWSHIRA